MTGEPALSAKGIPAVVIAGGRLEGQFAARAGTTIKALAPVSGNPLIANMLAALNGAPAAGGVVIVGPQSELSGELSSFLPRAHVVPGEGETGPENVQIGLRYLGKTLRPSPERVLLCTSDMPFVTSAGIESLIALSPENADIAYPIFERGAYEAEFPGSPNTFARLADREYTGGGVLLVRPSALSKNAALIEAVFQARKSQFALARLLGLPFLLRFLTRTLTVAGAETRATQITGCVCRAVRGAPVQLAADVDSLADYEYVLRRAGSNRNNLK